MIPLDYQRVSVKHPIFSSHMYNRNQKADESNKDAAIFSFLITGKSHLVKSSVKLLQVTFVSNSLTRVSLHGQIPDSICNVFQLIL